MDDEMLKYLLHSNWSGQQLPSAFGKGSQSSKPTGTAQSLRAQSFAPYAQWHS